jgi:hypothetical protein
LLLPLRKKNQKNQWPEDVHQALGRVRHRVETVFSPLTTTFNVQRPLVAVLGPVGALEPRLWLQQGILRARTVVWLCGGGRGFWRLFRARFAGHTMNILEFHYAAPKSFILARQRLRRGETEQVLRKVAAAVALEGPPALAGKTLENLCAYLDDYRDRTD